MTQHRLLDRILWQVSKPLVALHDDRLSGQTTSCTDGHPPYLRKPNLSHAVMYEPTIGRLPSSANGQQTQGNQTRATFVGRRLPFWGFCSLAMCSSVKYVKYE